MRFMETIIFSHNNIFRNIYNNFNYKKYSTAMNEFSGTSDMFQR
jgi:hypothetical protein